MELSEARPIRYGGLKGLSMEQIHGLENPSICLDKIVRNNGQVGLGDKKTIEGEDLKWFGEVYG